MTDDSFENEKNNKHKAYPATDNIYREIYKTYYYTDLSKEAQIHVDNVINQFLVDGIIGKDDFKEAAPILFDMQPTVGEIHSARQECLLSGEKFLANIIPDSIVTENEEIAKYSLAIKNYNLDPHLSNTPRKDDIDRYRISLENYDIKRDVLLKESYLILYHYLSRYWAVREGADIALSPDDVLNLSYDTICLGAETILLLQKKNFADVNNFKEKLAPLKKEFTKIFQKISLDQGDNESNSNYFIKLLRRLNAIRLFWLWNRITLEAFILSIHNALINFTIAATHLSWSLYLFLGCVHVTGVIQGYFEAKARADILKISAEKAGLAHLKLRRDVLVNDVIWGFANLACCFWLCGLGIYGSIGDLLTGLLLCMDLRMNYLRLHEEGEKFAEDIDDLNKSMQNIINKNIDYSDEDTKEILDCLKENINNNNYDYVNYLLKKLNVAIQKDKCDENIKKLYWQLKSIHARKEERANAWQDKKLMLYSDIFYAAFIIVAFVMLCSFYLAFASMTMPLMIGLVGAVSLAAATLVWRSANSYIETGILKRDKNLIKQEYNDLIEEYVENYKTLSEARKNQICLSILDKGAQLCYKEEESRYKKMEIFRETANRLLIPGAIAMNFLFLPESLGGAPTFVFLFVGILVAAVITSFLIKKYYQPKNTKWKNSEDEESSKPCLLSYQFNEVKLLLEIDLTLEAKNERILTLIRDNRTENNSPNTYNDNDEGVSVSLLSPGKS